MAVQDRKTVACDELDAYFEKNPHPDGKIMAALAVKLGLNKKQVSNFFERSRRKANIVVESRRKGGGVKQSVTPAPETFTPATPAASAPSGASTSFAAAAAAAAAQNTRKRARRGGKNALYEEDDAEEDENSNEELEDLEDGHEEEESEVEQKTRRRQQTKSKAATSAINAYDDDEDQEEPTAELDGSSPERAQPDPATYRIAASRYQTRRAGPVEYVPLPPTNSINPALLPSPAASVVAATRGASPSVLSAATLTAQNSPTATAAQSKGKKSTHRKKRKTSSTPSIPAESPTVQFLKNPFPTPVASPEDAYTAASGGGGYASSVYSNDAQAERVRRQARVWFQKTESNFALQAITGNGKGSFSPYSPYARYSSPIPAVEKIRHTIPSVPLASNNIQEAAEEDKEDYESEMESAYDEEESAAIRREQSKSRPGAALRSTIACSELRQAFLGNPHPAAAVLDALAIRLGLGKKQVSNYFVRERKKAGYQIKVRHGLNAKRRRGAGNKQKPSSAVPGQHPSVVVTQHQDEDAFMQEIEEEEEEEMEGQDYDFDDDVSETDLVPASTAAASEVQLSQNTSITSHNNSNSTIGADDLPDLAYDDVASLRSENMSSISESVTMMRTMNHSQQSSVMTDELASPPYGVAPLLLPPFGMAGHGGPGNDAKGGVYGHGAMPRIV